MFKGGLGQIVSGEVINQEMSRRILADLQQRKELIQFTFEDNAIADPQGVCNIFRHLANYDKLESLNFRCNKGFSDEVVAALADGIRLKKELRVSIDSMVTF